MSLYFRAKRFFKYQWEAKTQYYLHSPFVYRLYTDILLNGNFKALEPLTRERKKLKQNAAKVYLEDFGTKKSRYTTVCAIERNTSIPSKYGNLLYSFVKHFRPSNILEIGTSIGISSSYIALACSDARIVTLEGSSEVAAIARQTHNSLGLKNAEIIEGEFSQSLPVALNRFAQLDFVYFDGNHTMQATLSYFEMCLTKLHEQSVFVFDDIYWNREMSDAWEIIKQHPSVTLSVDVYKFGICFFRKEKLAKEHFVLRY